MALTWKAAFPNMYFVKNIAGRQFQWLKTEKKLHVKAVKSKMSSIRISCWEWRPNFIEKKRFRFFSHYLF